MDNQSDLLKILDRYQGRLTARVAEDCGGVFDVALHVGPVEVAALRLRSDRMVMIHRDHKGEPVGIDLIGGQMPLPE